MAGLDPYFVAGIKAAEADVRAMEEEDMRDEMKLEARRRKRLQGNLPQANPASLGLVSEEALTTFSEETGQRALGVDIVTSVDPTELIRPLLYERMQVDLAVANAALIDSYRHDFERVVPTFSVSEQCFMLVMDATHDQPDDSAERTAFGPMGEKQVREALKRGFSAEIIARVNKTLGDPDVIALAGGRNKLRVPLLYVPLKTSLPDWKTLPVSFDGVAALRLVLPAKGTPEMHREMVFFALQRLLLDMLPRPVNSSRGEVLEFAYYLQFTAVELYVRWSSADDCQRRGLLPLPPDTVVYRNLAEAQRRRDAALARNPKLAEAGNRELARNLPPDDMNDDERYVQNLYRAHRDHQVEPVEGLMRALRVGGDDAGTANDDPMPGLDEEEMKGS